MTPLQDEFEALMPEPAGFRTRYRSEPEMIGHYPWTYADAERRRPKYDRPECEYENLYTADQMREMFDAATELAAKKEWRPIATAPKHIEVLVWREDSGPFIAKLTTPDAVITVEEMERESLEFPDDFEEWFSDAYGWQEGSEKPTHWMPLPDEPDAAAIRARDGKGATE